MGARPLARVAAVAALLVAGCNHDHAPIEVTSCLPRSLPTCSAEGFCPSLRSVTRQIRAVAAIDRDNAFFVGNGGLAIRARCQTWEVVPAETVANLTAAWATPDGDAWAFASDGGVLHFDGTGFRMVRPGRGGNPYWGFNETLWRAVGGSGSDDVWAARHWVDWDVERDDNPLHFDGRTWSEVALADTPDIRSIVALGKNDVWLATLRDVVRLGMGAQVTVPALRGSYSLWGTSCADLWAALDGKLVHYDGNGLQPFTLPGAAQRVWGREATDVFVALHGQGVSHYDGNTWSTPALFEIGNPADWSTSGDWMIPNAVPLNTDLIPYRFTGADFEPLLRRQTDPPLLLTRTTRHSAIRIHSATDIWAGLNHWDGTRWATDPTPIMAIDGVSDTDLWAVGDDAVRHFDGAKWSTVEVSPQFDPIGIQPPFNALLVVSPTEVWVAGRGGHLSAFDGRTWKIHLVGRGSDILYMKRRDDGQLFLLDIRGSLWLGTDGQKELPRAEPVTGDQHRLFLEGGEVFVVDTDNQANPLKTKVVHLEGGRLVTVRTLDSGTIRTILASGNEIWAAGSGVYQWDGSAFVSTWSVAGLDPQFTAMAAGPGGETWIAGQNGLVMHYDGTRWTGLPSGTVDDLVAASTRGGGLTLLAGNGEVYHRASR